MKINGVMIDCSRFMEPHIYYFRLVDFMAAWGMNTLLLHFSDDEGCGIELPGFESLAMPGAFSVTELRKLIGYADKKGIEIIPELECFGHTRYITDRPEYADLATGGPEHPHGFNALQPDNPRTLELMAGLIRETAKLFPSKRMHLGCDEVNMGDYCSRRDLDEAEAWADYVNALVDLARHNRKEPMIWADHPTQNPAIAERLRKDVVLVDWRYEEGIRDNVVGRLRFAGFKDIINAPSLACYRHRFLPTTHALENTRRMALASQRHETLGVINTIWCPWRYLRNAMYYGIAHSARTVQGGGKINRRFFHQEFAKKVFGTELTRELDVFLNCWTEIAIRHDLLPRILGEKDAADWTPEQWPIVDRAHEQGLVALDAARHYTPARNRPIWEGMVLAARAAWLCAESAMIRRDPEADPDRVKTHNALLKKTRRDMTAEWDLTRDPKSPHKKPKNNNHALYIIAKLKYI
jgi:hypothetical protein